MHTTRPHYNHPVVVVLLAIAFAFVGARPVIGQCEPDVQNLRAGDGTSADFNGSAVDVDGDWLLVGAPSHGGAGADAGMAYIYRRTTQGWGSEQQLIPSLLEAGDKFGAAVAISGNVAVVGARGQGLAGTVYVFRYNGSTWRQEAALVPSDGKSGDAFGYSVGLSGNVALIGAYGVDDLGTSSGAAYVFRYDGARWNQEAKLYAPDAAPSDFFGVGVAVDGNVAVVGAYLDDDLGSSSGSAYVFRFDGTRWSEEDKLLASDGMPDDRLGTALGVSGNIIVAGVENNDTLGTTAGAAYVFRFDGSRWVENARLTASDGEAADQFGKSVGVSGSAVAVGAPGYDTPTSSNTGAVYVYSFDGTRWTEANLLVAPDGWYDDAFGTAAAIDSSSVAVGSPNDDNLGNNSGSAYIFELPCLVSGCQSNADCDDGAFCNGAETCLSGVCHAGTPPCSGSLCNESSNSCVECLANADCDDGAFCNGAETCVSGACRAGTPPCSGSLCNESSNSCVECLANSDCDDGAFCNGAETCFNGACYAGTPPCSGSLCNESSNACVECLANSDCNDGLFCNGTESCFNGACRAGTPPCSGSLCNESSNACVECLSNSDCDDGAFCNGAETCVGGACYAGTPPCSGSLCNESSNSCVECLANADCDDGAFCNGAETCVSGVCHAGTPPCSGSLCNESSNACVECLANADCDDGNECTDDSCQAGTCVSVNNTASCLADAGCTTTGVCESGQCVCPSFAVEFDVAAFVNCMRGPDRFAQYQCRGFDVNGDNSIDLNDFGDLDLGY